MKWRDALLLGLQSKRLRRIRYSSTLTLIVAQVRPCTDDLLWVFTSTWEPLCIAAPDLAYVPFRPKSIPFDRLVELHNRFCRFLQHCEPFSYNLCREITWGGKTNIPMDGSFCVTKRRGKHWKPSDSSQRHPIRRWWQKDLRKRMTLELPLLKCKHRLRRKRKYIFS